MVEVLRVVRRRKWIIVVAVVALGAFAGWRRGFIMPLVGVAVGLLGLYALYAGPGASLVPGGVAGIGLGVLVIGIAGTFVLRIVGVLVGLVGTHFKIEGVTPVIAGYSIPLAFGIAIAVGVFFGLYPANRAASLRPIDALRYE